MLIPWPGFVESFSGFYICRFCVGQRSQFEESEVRAGVFPVRTKQQHELDIQDALTSGSHCHGFKKHSAVTQRLSQFHVTTGYPPDVLHDLLEGIVPPELALRIDTFMKKKYFMRNSTTSSNSFHTNRKTRPTTHKVSH